MTHELSTLHANAKIQGRILALVAQGLDPLEALSKVVGPALVASLIDEVYATLRAER